MKPGLTIKGSPASSGHAAGTLAVFADQATDLIETPGTIVDEVEHLTHAIKAASADLTGILENTADDDAAGMLEFQIAMLEDDTFLHAALRAISGGAAATFAWRATLDDEIRDYESADDEYFRARSVDLMDLRDRVLRHLYGKKESAVPPGAIVVADDLTPSRFLEHCGVISGIALHRGSSSSHVAILARARGVPMVIQLGDATLQSGKTALLNADTGELTIDPNDQQQARFSTLRADAEQQRLADREHLYHEARLVTGERVQVLVSIAHAGEIENLDAASCDGVGLVRTEFLFEGQTDLPNEEDQFAVYRRLLEWAAGRPVIIRTLDAGADKPIPTLTTGDESNPFLGVRGLRLSLARPDVFRIQLRALLRASRHGVLRIMLPMVTAPSELEQAHALIEAARAELASEGITAELPEVGIMVEVPACAISIEDFGADFYSIGSNDLLQYLTACGRDCGALEHLARPDNPALLELIKRVVDHGDRVGKSVSLCGDMGGDRRYLGLLLDLGLRSVSVAPAALAQTKALIAKHGVTRGD